MFARLKVILGSVVTYLTILGAGIGVAAQQVASAVPDGYQDNVIYIGGVVAGIITAAVAIIRLVTPVIPEDRGILPPDRPANAEIRVVDEYGDRGVTLVEIIVVLVVIALFALAVGWWR